MKEGKNGRLNFPQKISLVSYGIEAQIIIRSFGISFRKKNVQQS